LEAQGFRIKIMKKAILLLSIIFLNSCSLFYNASKNSNEGNRKFSAQKVIRTVNKNTNNIKFIQAKAKVSLRDKNKMKSSTVTLRISSNEKIWVSAALGAARVIIDNDSIKYYNKIEKNFFVSDFNYVNEIIGFDTNFKILQNLILGLLIEQYDYSSLVEKTEKSYSFKKKLILGNKPVESTVYISPYSFRILKLVFSQGPNNFQVLYEDYLELKNQNIPTKIRFLNNGVENISIEIKSIASLEKINLPFRIPQNYKRINLK